MSQPEDIRASVMTSIRGMGHTDEAIASAAVIPSITSPKKKAKAGVLGFDTGTDGTLKEEWDPYLPRPPSMRKIEVDRYANAEQVAVFNANTAEGSTMVRVLSEKGLKVVAAVRVFTSRNTKQLIKLPGVTVKVADWNDESSLLKVAEGCSRAFLVTKYWATFDSNLEEQMATNILRACARVTPVIKHLVLATFEDTSELKARGRKSQIVPTRDGRIYPNFDGMLNIDKMAKQWGVQITHMMTSYLDEAEQKKSLILIRGENNRIIVQPYFQEGKKGPKM
jgi:NmrA-like family